jgi:hypothetical protein
MRLTIAGLAILLLCPVMANAQTIKLGEVLILGVPQLKPDADTAAFERFVRNEVAPAWKTRAPGMDVALARADRGSRKDQYVLAWTTDTRTRHKTYGSTDGDSPFAPELRAKMEDLRPGAATFVSRMGYLEYHLLSPEKVGPLPEIDVLGIHFIKVRPDRREAFERFVAEELHPAVGNLRPDLRLLYYKSVRGGDDVHYLTIFALTTQSRDKYWPKGSDSDDVRAAFGPVRSLTKELSTYLVEGSYLAEEKAAAPVFESKEWTDFVCVK